MSTVRVDIAGDPPRTRAANGSAEVTPPHVGTAREAALRQYRALCEGGRG